MNSPKFITLCAWCEGTDVITRAAEAMGHTVSHGICDPCKAKLLADIEPARFLAPVVQFSCRPARRYDFSPAA